MLTFSRLIRRSVKGPSHPQFIARPNTPAAILSSIESTYVLSNPFPSKPSIVFSPHKPFCSQPNYSSWWLGGFCAAFLFFVFASQKATECHDSLPKFNIKSAKTWTPFSNNVNTTIRKYSSRASIWVVTPLGFVGQFRIYKFSWFSQIRLWQ